MRLEFHPEAEEEFLDAVSFYESLVPGLGQRFNSEVQTAAARLLAFPEIGPPLEASLRKLVLERFPYCLIYSFSTEVVHIVAVAHERRKPGYWQERV
jgi:plasmid stabilization system protein ParE